jgi:periplasmic protein CpxP/Spy
MIDDDLPTPSTTQDASPRSYPGPDQSMRLSRGLLTIVMLALAVGLIGYGLIGAVAGSAFGGWSGYGPPWRHHGGFGGQFDPAAIEDRADRAVRHLAVEIDATADQQDKLRAVVKAAVKDLLPMRDRMRDARQKARELLTQPTVDRTAIERLRADQVAAFDTASRRAAQALADAADVLTPEQRRKVGDLVSPNWSGWRR